MASDFQNKSDSADLTPQRFDSIPRNSLGQAAFAGGWLRGIFYGNRDDGIDSCGKETKNKSKVAMQ
jgi:hypothetical protein